MIAAVITVKGSGYTGASFLSFPDSLLCTYLADDRLLPYVRFGTRVK